MKQKTVKYAIIGKETASTGTKHLQCYFQFNKAMDMISLKTFLKNDKWHLEKAMGSKKSNVDYCSKEATAIKEGCSVKRIAEDYPVATIKYFEGIEKLHELIGVQIEKPKPIVTIQFGDSGTGKSFNSRLDVNSNEVYTYIPGNSGNNWFNGYIPELHKCVIFDEYNGSVLRKDKLKQLIDIYPVNVEIKGGTLQFVPKYIYINSNRNPLTWYNGLIDTEWKAIFRRCNSIKYYSGNDFKEVQITDIIKDNSNDNEINYEGVLKDLKNLLAYEVENIAHQNI